MHTDAPTEAPVPSSPMEGERERKTRRTAPIHCTEVEEVVRGGFARAELEIVEVGRPLLHRVWSADHSLSCADNDELTFLSLSASPFFSSLGDTIYLLLSREGSLLVTPTPVSWDSANYCIRTATCSGSSSRSGRARGRGPGGTSRGPRATGRPMPRHGPLRRGVSSLRGTGSRRPNSLRRGSPTSVPSRRNSGARRRSCSGSRSGHGPILRQGDSPPERTLPHLRSEGGDDGLPLPVNPRRRESATPPSPTSAPLPSKRRPTSQRNPSVSPPTPSEESTGSLTTHQTESGRIGYDRQYNQHVLIL